MAFQTTKVCEHCGCRFVIEDEEAWAYKRYMRMPGDRMCKVHWFHTWSCLVAAQKKADDHFEPIFREQRERELEKKREYERLRRRKRRAAKRDGARCKAEPSCAIPDNKRKEENLSP